MPRCSSIWWAVEASLPQPQTLIVVRFLRIAKRQRIIILHSSSSSSSSNRCSQPPPNKCSCKVHLRISHRLASNTSHLNSSSSSQVKQPLPATTRCPQAVEAITPCPPALHHPTILSNRCSNTKLKIKDKIQGRHLALIRPPRTVQILHPIVIRTRCLTSHRSTTWPRWGSRSSRIKRNRPELLPPLVSKLRTAIQHHPRMWERQITIHLQMGLPQITPTIMRLRLLPLQICSSDLPRP